MTIQYSPLVCLTNGLLAPMVWSADDGALSVVNQRIKLTDHDASVGFLRGKLPARTWVHLRSVNVTPVFATTETVQLKALDSDLQLTDRWWTETVQASDTSTGIVEANRSADKVIPLAGALLVDMTSALTLNDDIFISAWGHVFTEPFRI